MDPDEGIGVDGTIVTGVARERVPAIFEPTLRAITASMTEGTLYLYGSVATGQARPGVSDLDLLSVGPGPVLRDAPPGLVRAVEVSVSSPEDLLGEGDEAYGNRVFLRHYCVLLAGPDLSAGWPAFKADALAARGFNGDIARRAEAWREALQRGETQGLARKMARKTLLALSGLVSVHDGIWTTDRGTAARVWSQVRPELAHGLEVLVAWSEESGTPSSLEIQKIMDEVVSPIVDDFRSVVGLWS
nr:nucleotidyltransferase domain-containing protein [Kineosporia rhizophila]